MRPILFYIGPFPIFSFGMMISFGLMLSLFLMSRLAAKKGFPKENDVFDLVLAVVISGFLGARIHYVFQNGAWYLHNPLHIFELWEGGLIFYGGMIGSLIGIIAFMRIKKIPVLKGLDFLLPFVSLTHGFGRIGCFMNGCCYGKVCDLPWAVKFPDLALRVHPTQLYEAVFDFILFGALYFRYGKKRFDGEIAAFYFIFYSIGRFVIEFFRENPGFMFFTFNQWISLAAIAAGSIFYFALSRKSSIRHDAGK